MDKLYIDMPDDLEIENQINFIVEQGIEEKEGFYNHIKNMYKAIGFNNLFHDKSELTFISVLCMSIVALFIFRTSRDIYLSKESMYAYIFMISPLFYFVTNIFSLINMKENNTYQVEMVCKYNIYQVSSLRMLIFSIICIFINTLIILAVYDRIDFIKGFMISMSSLFLFSTIFLYSILRIKNIITKYIVIVGWIVLNAAMSILDIRVYSNILSSIPTYVYAIVTMGCIYLYFKNIVNLSGYNKTLYQEL